MNLSDMRRWLKEGKVRLTRSLGQNFLHDGNQLRRIVAAAELSRADKVLEIGPGLGPLTERLLAEAGEVLAIEKDLRLVESLQQRLAGAGCSPGQDRDLSSRADSKNLLSPSRSPFEEEKLSAGPLKGGQASAHSKSVLRLIHADAFAWLKEHPQDWHDWKVVANLPYSVASPLLVELAEASEPPERMVVTLQMEVAQRLSASANTADYGILTLLLQLRYERRGWFRIPASCFFPAPNVDSACVTLIRRSEPLLPRAEAETFTRIVKRSFSQRRKMMLKLLKSDWPANVLQSGFMAAGLSDTTRAESVSLNQFVALTRYLSPVSGMAP